MAAAQAAGLKSGDAVEVAIRQENIRLTRAVSPQRSRTLGGYDGAARIVHAAASRCARSSAHACTTSSRSPTGSSSIVETPTNGPHAGSTSATAVALSVDPAPVYVGRAEA